MTNKFSAEGLDIEYVGDPRLPYGVSATAAARPFAFIITHYTGSSAPFRNIVKYTLSVDKERGGQFGYHFLIDRDGKIVQAAPLSKRTNQIRTNAKIGVSNTNAIGISLHNLGETPTPAQLKSGAALGRALQKAFDIPRTKIFGHGEINSHKEPIEGLTLARILRGE